MCAGDETLTNKASCEHKHVLCVTCAEEAGEVRMRVQTNSLPDHCWRTSFIRNVPSYTNKDFTVTWNADVRGVLNYTEMDISRVSDVDVLLCDL